jgi:predicted AAA+ superfamily ATPase
MHGITEPMAGRAAILQLLPFSVSETSKVNLLYGGFPEVLARPKSRSLWFASYLQTYLPAKTFRSCKRRHSDPLPS